MKNIFKPLFLSIALLSGASFAMEMEDKGKRKIPETVGEEQPTKKQAVDLENIFFATHIVINNSTDKALEIYPLSWLLEEPFTKPEQKITVEPGKSVVYNYKLFKDAGLGAYALGYLGKIFFKQKNSSLSPLKIFFKKEFHFSRAAGDNRLKLLDENQPISLQQSIATAKDLTFDAEIARHTPSYLPLKSITEIIKTPTSGSNQFFNIIVDIKGDESNNFAGSTISASVSDQRI